MQYQWQHNITGDGGGGSGGGRRGSRGGTGPAGRLGRGDDGRASAGGTDTVEGTAAGCHIVPDMLVLVLPVVPEKD